MIEIEYKGIEKEEEMPEIDYPQFLDYKPDLEAIEEFKKKYEDIENLIVIGNGGSITSYRAIKYAFPKELSVNSYIVNTMEPDYLENIKKSTETENTLVLAISKSGNTVGVIESLLYFINNGYTAATITSEKNSAINDLTQKLDLDTLEHPEIGGRFTGAVETALLPAALSGLDYKEIRKGAEEEYKHITSGKHNIPRKTAEILYSSEKQGFQEVLTPFYSTRLFGFYPLLVQLMHESVCKEGEGQTFYGDIAPEYQHHTNQRLFGGKQNVVPMFFTVSKHPKDKIFVKENLREIELKNYRLGDLDGKNLSESLKSEYLGVKKALIEEKKPFITLSIDSINYSSVGGLIAYLQFLAIYSAEIRDVNPYNQPNVEKSKDQGIKHRFDETYL